VSRSVSECASEKPQADDEAGDDDEKAQGSPPEHHDVGDDVETGGADPAARAVAHVAFSSNTGHRPGAP
jgi:hypothetical protein